MRQAEIRERCLHPTGTIVVVQRLADAADPTRVAAWLDRAAGARPGDPRP